VSVAVDALDTSELAGIVHEIGVPRAGSTVYPVTVRLDQEAAGARAGMAAEVTFEFSANEAEAASFKLPVTAVGEDRDGRFVYIVEPKEDGLGTVRRRPVEVGSIDSGGIAIREGLEGGERVVTAGVSRIDDGLTVRVPEPEDSPAEAPATAP